MDPLARIRKDGFRRWYERQLIESHAYFVTCFCCMILVAATLEASHAEGAGFDRFGMSFAAFAGIAGGIFSWRRYRGILERAEHVAATAVCAACGVAGSFTVVSHGETRSQSGDSEDATPWLKVRCRKCAHEWRMD